MFTLFFLSVTISIKPLEASPPHFKKGKTFLKIPSEIKISGLTDFTKSTPLASDSRKSLNSKILSEKERVITPLNSDNGGESHKTSISNKKNLGSHNSLTPKEKDLSAADSLAIGKNIASDPFSHGPIMGEEIKNDRMREEKKSQISIFKKTLKVE